MTSVKPKKPATPFLAEYARLPFDVVRLIDPPLVTPRKPNDKMGEAKVKVNAWPFTPLHRSDVYALKFVTCIRSRTPVRSKNNGSKSEEAQRPFEIVTPEN